MRHLLLAMALVCAVALVVSAGPGKNLKVYPKGTELSVIKKDMKVVAKSLGVQCDYCHDLDAMDADSEMKEAARNMMRMTAAANARLKKDGFKNEVGCVTCHAGEKKPKK